MSSKILQFFTIYSLRILIFFCLMMTSTAYKGDLEILQLLNALQDFELFAINFDSYFKYKESQKTI